MNEAEVCAKYIMYCGRTRGIGKTFAMVQGLKHIDKPAVLLVRTEQDAMRLRKEIDNDLVTIVPSVRADTLLGSMTRIIPDHRIIELFAKDILEKKDKLDAIASIVNGKR